MDIDALDAAAALAGIVEGAFDQIGDGIVQLDVGQHIGRVLAAEFQAERHEGSRRGLFDGAAAGHRAGEVDMVDLAGAEQSFGLRVVQHDVLENAFRQPGLLEGLAKRSPTSSVCAACLRITVEPAISAGTIVLTAVR